MQSTRLGPGFTGFLVSQRAASYQRFQALRLPIPAPSRARMDINDVLDPEKRAARNNELRRYHQTLQMNNGSGYGMSQDSTFPNHQQSIHQPAGLPYNMMAPHQHSPQLYAPSYMARHDSQSSFTDENFGHAQAKKQPATKQFPCSFADCRKNFARRSDLSRHALFRLKFPCAAQTNPFWSTSLQAQAQVTAALTPTTLHDSPQYVSPSESPPGHPFQVPKAEPASPHPGLPPMVTGMQRQNSDYGYPPQHLPLPAHLRAGFQQNALRTTSPLNGQPLHNYTSAPQPQRSSTSYPTAYGPPQPMEPPANGTASGGASPHLGAWTSPNPGTLPPPFAVDGSAYQESGFGGHQMGLPQLNNHQLGNHHLNGHQLYYHPVNGMGRPQSTEPKDYGLQQHQAHIPPPMPLNHDWHPDTLDPQHHRQGSYGTWRHNVTGRPPNGGPDH
ncbi:hypothetical protein A1O7_09907 [Cladophialophora yegresii CBS 114405]|uniref:C2H2-type domain-containing protein n=1 Tax=Cladophialophora yegresii CBS 114405 TaxID=1182544 RepID=W9VQX6_9EURO|nr:uncharacterized protein A1O7_09907 [Cladophialophora yegresii CBS 114405]EXJ54566.1 hypothetical protein A1O7_09907 [Cladophialophora yegresii CBS 114405]